jgi:hypothetical protein
MLFSGSKNKTQQESNQTMPIAQTKGAGRAHANPLCERLLPAA